MTSIKEELNCSEVLMVGHAWCVIAHALLTCVLEVVILVVIQHIERVLLQLGALNSASILPFDLLTCFKVSHEVGDALTVHPQQLLVFLPHRSLCCIFALLIYY